MSRYYLVNEFNYYTRKRDCYAEKIQKNNELKTILEQSLANCNTYMQGLEIYADDAAILKQLYDKNHEYFNLTENTSLVEILNLVGEHLLSEKDSAQGEINYWYNKIQEYDAEKRRLEEEAKNDI